MADTVTLKGAGGSEFVFDLPLPDVYAEQVERNLLRPADDESRELLAGEPATTPERPPEGGPGSGTEAWREYAASLGVEDVGSMDRDELIAAVEELEG